MAQHYEVIRVSHEDAEVLTVALPLAVEFVQVDVGEQRRDHAALGGPRVRIAHDVLLVQHARIQPLPEQLQHAAITDPATHEVHQHDLVDRVEETLDVAVDDEVTPATTFDAQLFQCLRGAPPRAEAVAALFETRLVDRLDHQLRRHLDHTVLDRRYPERSLPTVRFRDPHAPHRLRSVAPVPDLVAHFREELRNAPLLDHRQRHAVDASSAIVAPHSLPRLLQDVTPPDPIE
jgi:hypothetical protein